MQPLFFTLLIVCLSVACAAEHPSPSAVVPLDHPAPVADNAPAAPPAPAAQTAAPPPSPASPPAERLVIQLLGSDLPASLLSDMDYVRRSIEAFYRFEVTVPAPLPLPQEAYYAPRRRYRAERLLDFLQEVEHGEGDRIMGITTVDISTTKDGYEDWGILGLATLDGTVCVISTFRTGPRDADAPTWKKERATIRLGKTVVHELGHNLGLPHCPHRGCLMEDAMGSVSTTDRETTFCDDCLRTLMDTHPDIVVPHPVPPWPVTAAAGRFRRFPGRHEGRQSYATHVTSPDKIVPGY